MFWIFRLPIIHDAYDEEKKHINLVQRPSRLTSTVTNTLSKKSSKRDLPCKAGRLNPCAGKANISKSYVLLRDGEAFLFGANITPMAVASTHVVCDPTRTRKLLLRPARTGLIVRSRQSRRLYRSGALPILEKCLVQSENRRRQR